MKKALLVLIFAMQFVAVGSVGTKEMPYPSCFPCPDGAR